ncbi:MAG: tail fiber domain-containing protein [Gemmatimonadetes bacterium]|nr:tail fiber domain-containing protein [Gemmatimonadota bacterium]
MVDFTDGIDVVVGGAILASHTDNLADNTEFNRSWGDVEHNYDISTADGSHKDITFGADSTYDIAETAVRPAVVYSDKFDVLAGGEVSLDGGNGTYIKEITDDVIVLGIDSVNQTYFDDDKLNAAWDLDTDDGTLRVNWTGYQGGTTRYRDIVVYTGKSVPMTWWDGSANITYYYSDLNLAESLTVAQNKAIYLDTDKDTYFLAPTDDRIDYYVAGQQKLIIGSTYVQVINAELQLTGGDIILDVDGDSKLDNVSDDILAVVMGAGEVGRWDASGYNGVLGATTPAAATVTTLASSAGISVTGDGSFASDVAQFYTDATNGLVITGHAGTTNDVIITDGSGTVLIRNPVGTTQLNFDANALLTTGTLGAGAATVASGSKAYGAGTVILSAESTSGSPVLLLATAGNESTSYVQWNDGTGGGPFELYDAGASATRLAIDNAGAVTIAGTLGAGATTVTTLVTSGNMGIKVTPETWFASYAVEQLGGNAFLASTTTPAASNDFLIGLNAYLSAGGSWTKISDDEASRYYQQNGSHVFQSAASGTGTFSWTTAANFDISGMNGVLGATTPAAATVTTLDATTSMTLTNDQNDVTNLTVDNGTAGTGAAARLVLAADAGIGYLMTLSGSYTTSGFYAADGMRMFSDSNLSGGMAFGVNHATADISFWTANGSQRMTIDGASGNVGIGTASPDSSLSINSANPRVRFHISDVDKAQVGYNNIVADAAEFGTLSTDPIVFHVNSAEVVRIDASGNLGLGVSPSFVLDILDAGTAGYTMQLHNNGGVAGNFGIQMLCGADDGSGQTIYINALDGDGSQNGYIEHSAGGTFQLVNVSDERLKEDIEPTTIKGIAGIRKIEVIDFTRPKSGVRVEGGFSAQQLQTIYPQAVSEMEDGFLGVADTALVAPLVKSVQELDGTMQTFMGRDLERKTELETLREKVEAQGKEIVELQEQLKRAA